MKMFNETDWVQVNPADRVLEYSKVVSDYIDTCVYVPYKVNLTIFYKGLGSLQGKNIYEIVGTKVR